MQPAWLRAHLALVAEAGGDQPLLQRRDVPRTRSGTPSRVDAAAEGARRTRCPSAAGSTTPATHLAVDLGRDRDGVLRQPVEVVDGAVDRVDDPADAARARASAPSSPRKPSSGRAAEQPGADQLLDGAVGLGDDVGRRWTWCPRRRRPAARIRTASGRPASAATSSASVEQVVGRGRSSAGAPRRTSAGRCDRAGWGSSRPGTRRATRAGCPTTARTGSSPRSAAARSRSRSRTIATNRGSTPAVAARANGRPSSLGGLQRLGVEVVDDLHVVGDEADRHHHHRRTPLWRASASQVVVDVGLEPRHVRRAGPRAEDQVAAVPGAGLLAAPARRSRRRRCGAGRRRRRPRGPLASFIAVGIECVTNTRCASRRTSSGSSASPDRVASTIGSTKPGWLK